MKRVFLAFSCVLMISGTLTQAAPLRTTERELPGQQRAPVVYPDLSLKKWWLFAGIDVGGIRYSSIDPAFEGVRSGFSFGGRLLVSRHSENFVMDGGLGWKWITASGVNPNNTKDTISSRVPYLDFSVRYRVNDRFQIGPEFEFWLGTDNGLNEYIASAESNNGKFLGVEAVYEWDRFRKHRIGGRVLTSLGVPGRTVLQYLAFYQISFDVFGEKVEQAPARSYEQVSQADLAQADSLTPREPIPMASGPDAESSDQDLGYSEPAPDVMSTPAPPEENIEPEGAAAPSLDVAGPGTNVKKTSSRQIVVVLGNNDLPFGQTDAKLPLAHQARIRNIGKYLAKNQAAWKKLEILSHTDERGDDRKNQKLSLRRAELIRNLLIKGGVSGKRIKAYGLGESRPLSRGRNEKAYAKNQRVELKFSDVKDSTLIRKLLEQ